MGRRCDDCGGGGDAAAAEAEAPRRAAPFCRGDVVEARYRGGRTWYAGKIIGGDAENGYVVRYDDDDEVERVPRVIRIRRPAAAAPPTTAPPRPPLAAEAYEEPMGSQERIGVYDLLGSQVSTVGSPPGEARPAEPRVEPMANGPSPMAHHVAPPQAVA